jgi:hypothetical protein
MGAEKVSMNIVVIGQVQSTKAINTTVKVIAATSQLMVSKYYFNKKKKKNLFKYHCFFDNFLK